MRQIVNSDQDLCVGCNRCTRACPIEMANLAYQDNDENIKVKIDGDQCIACGECIKVCKHDARYYVDDTQQFFADLISGVPISIIAAPSIKTNIYEWKRLFTYFKNAGVEHIYDVSLGADICIWAHLRCMQAQNPPALITQPCAAIVSYCEKHRHELLPNLSPVQSPMGCAAVYMGKYLGITTKIAALSPCVAKANEFASIGLISYNVTFAKLLNYLKENGIELPTKETGFDHDPGGLGMLFPSPGGLKENIEYFLGKTIRIDRSEGQRVYENLDTYAVSKTALLPDVFDVLNCVDGCNAGPGCVHNRNVFEIESVMNTARRGVTDNYGFEHCRKLHQKFDNMLNLKDFYRAYTPIETALPKVSEEAIAEAFAQLGKDTYAKQNFNCGACGSDSCRHMARKIALNINLPVNCVIKSRDDARADHLENIALAQRNAEYIELIRTIGHNLSSIDDVNYHEVVLDSIKALCLTLRETSLYVWRRDTDSCSGQATFKRMYGWAEGGSQLIELVYEKQIPAIISQLAQGRPVTKNLSGMNQQERDLFVPYHVISTCAVPIFIKGGFWGFVACNSDYEKEYSEEQLSLIASVSMLIVAGIVERELNESLIAAREEALANTKAKSEFLSRMSHEIRTPMNAIIGMAKIAETTQDIDRMRQCLSSIGVSSTHLLGLINDILDMSKIEAGKFELSVAPFNVEEMLKRTCGLMTEVIQRKDMKLLINVEEGMPLGYIGDDLRLSQVIANILSNAVKFTPEHGEIRVSVSLLYTAEKECKLRFSITDTGIGMTTEQIGRLFTSFEQADGSITRRFGGTGLGLAISKNIIEKMGGRISVTSQVGKGSTFIIDVLLERDRQQKQPSAAATSAPDQPHEASPVPDFSGITLLLAEDVEINREIFTVLLSDTNVTIDIAENGLIALEKFRSAPDKYDIIVMDIQMPDMDGIEATKRIRSLNMGRSATVPIIAMTANAFKEDVEKCLASGMNDHLAKPIDVDIVRQKIKHYTKRP